MANTPKSFWLNTLAGVVPRNAAAHSWRPKTNQSLPNTDPTTLEFQRFARLELSTFGSKRMEA